MGTESSPRPVFPQQRILSPLCTGVRGRRIPRSSAVASSSRQPPPVVVVLLGCSSASQVPYLLDDGRDSLYLVEHRIGSSLQDVVEVPRRYGRAKHHNRDACIR